MKKLIFVLALLSLTGTAMAEQATNIVEVLRDTHTCAGVSIDNAAATDVVVDTGQAYTFVSVLNEDAAANLFCSERSNTTTSGALRGFRVTPGQLISWKLRPGMRWYCRSAAGAPSDAMICRGR